jgi:hypothetical protein
MSTQGNGQPGRYDVRLSEHQKSIVRQLHRDAVLAGNGKQFLISLRQILERLRKDSLVFGDPVYRLPALKLLICHAVILPVFVAYGVHEERPLVFIRDFKLLD